MNNLIAICCGKMNIAPRLVSFRSELSWYLVHRRSTTSRASIIATAAPPGPILTFLSSSPTHSREAVHFLNELFELPKINNQNGLADQDATRRDSLDQFHFGGTRKKWDSVACACPTSGTILHFMSFSPGKNQKAREKNETKGGDPSLQLKLIAIHGSDSSSPPSTTSSKSSADQYSNALVECRQRLAKNIQSMQIFEGEKPGSLASTLEARARGLVVVVSDILGREPNPAWILSGKTSPLLDLMSFSSNETTSLDKESAGPTEREKAGKQSRNTGKLKELALPFFHGLSSSIQTKLSNSSLLRPLPGLYQCAVGQTRAKDAGKRNATANPGLIFRPLPAAEEDLRLSSPSLVFQCESLAKAQKLVEGKLGGAVFKIGWRGHGKLGSLIVSHPSILGLDIRICESASNDWVLSSSFDEAQESLLAGSLADLQSTHVVSEGKIGVEASSRTVDKKNDNGDCWVELRSNVKHPTGFLNQFVSSLLNKPARMKVAKPPDIPYE